MTEKEQIKLWVAELRSGKYKQIRGWLNACGGYCCFGVACKILIPEPLLIISSHSNTISGGYPSDQTHAPKWLKELNLDFIKKSGQALSHINDNTDFTFDEIADLIELVYIHKALD